MPASIGGSYGSVIWRRLVRWSSSGRTKRYLPPRAGLFFTIAD